MNRPYRELSNDDYRKLVNRSTILTMAGHCELSAEFISDELCFVMRGPSGMYILSGTSTDLKRLNAHWHGFAHTPGNGIN